MPRQHARGLWLREWFFTAGGLWPGMSGTEGTETATFAGGCFWCIEAVVSRIEGVERVVPGYCGGTTEDPTYEEVCSGTTGHAEVVEIEYDPSVIGFGELLEVFFAVHDPTSLNRQGPDVGTQYRSAVFYHDDSQREQVEAYIAELEADGVYDRPIVTEVAPREEFWEAEEYHWEYYEKNPEAAYCRVNITPKVEKVKDRFKDRVEAA